MGQKDCVILPQLSARLDLRQGHHYGIAARHLEPTSLEDWANAHTLSVAINGATIDAGSLWAMAGGGTEAVDWLRGDLDRFGDWKSLSSPLRANRGSPSISA